MKNLIPNLFGFLESLTLVDYILYFAILVLIILIVSLIYLLKTTDVDEELLELEDLTNEDYGEFDINDAIIKINEDKNNVNAINLTDYEREQEEKAIISYDELVKNSKNKKINYESDELLDNTISIKKVNLKNIASEEEENKIKVQAIRYEHEEAFLEALKKLDKLLN